MLRLACLILFAALAGAQSLPQSKHVSGVVVDQDGKPVPDARIDHASVRNPQLDAQGRFQFDTNAPIFVIRKPGFESVFLQTLDSSNAHVTLKPVAPKVVPTCPASDKTVGFMFRFSETSQVHATKLGHDIDYSQQNYIAEVGGKTVGIRHGAGPMWTFGYPLDSDVWASVHYEESAAVMGGQNVVDARGTTKDGTHWRYVGKFGESADYSGVDEATARILDQFLDGLCVK